MPDGPKSTTLGLCVYFAYSDLRNHDQWIQLATRLLDQGAAPTPALWPALHSFGKIVKRIELIKLLLDRGANLDYQPGNSGDTIRSLVKINKSLFSDEVLTVLGMYE